MRSSRWRPADQRDQTHKLCLDLGSVWFAPTFRALVLIYCSQLTKFPDRTGSVIRQQDQCNVQSRFWFVSLPRLTT